jgi:hypothetical protein
MQAVNKLIEEAISKEYLKYYKYNDFHNVEYFKNNNSGEIYRANLKNSEQYFTIKSFDFENNTIKEIVYEV